MLDLPDEFWNIFSYVFREVSCGVEELSFSDDVNVML